MSLTVLPAMIAPDESTTMPEMVPVTVWEKALPAGNKSSNATVTENQ
jgi:hypothetical protein